MTSDAKSPDSSPVSVIGTGEPRAALTGASVLKHDPKAWEEGFKAGESAARIPVRCPYPAGTTAAWSWHSGYVEVMPSARATATAAVRFPKNQHQAVQSSRNREA